jgi:3-hydroxyacyl-[acyl-carrier-protein] dehydratase
MKFILLDRITSLQPGKRITATKSLTLAEEYLADHFPTFPVMPGVLMLEAMVQASAWLVRATQDFSHSMIVLEEAKNITYKSFVAPGRTLEVTSEAVEIGESSSEFKAFGVSGETEMVKARLRLRHYNLAERDGQWSETDERLIADARRKFELLHGPAAVLPVTAESMRLESAGRT